MRLASWRRDGREAYGVVGPAGPQPASAAFAARYPSLAAVLAAGALAELSADSAAQPALGAGEFSWLPPVPRPGKILCVGMNYVAHIREMGRERPRYPALFARFPNSFVGHGQPVIRPRLSPCFDFEGELAVIIGRRARHVDRAQALACVAGYTCLMEGTIRDYQDHSSQFTAGKNFQSSGAMGPWLVSSDELPDPTVMRLETRVNGELMQRGEISDLCADIPAIIEYLSGICELEPGDVIATGTPSGVGAARKPPRWLAPGDLVEVAISGIGVLANPVADESAGETQPR